MFEENHEKPAQDRDPIEALSEVLERYENKPLLKKIEKNTSVLPTLLRALTITRGAKAAHMYVRDLPKPQKALRQAIESGKREAAASNARTRTTRNVTPQPQSSASPAAAAVTQAAVQAAEAVSAASPTVTPTPEPATAPRASGRRSAPAAAAAANERRRDGSGRFLSAGERERERQNQEQQAKGLKGWFKSAIGAITKAGEGKGDDVESAVGKSLGGPIYEAAKEMQGAVGELKEKLTDDKTLLGKSAKWLGKKTGLLKGPSAPPTEGAEQRRHRELLEAIQHEGGGGGGGGGGGISDAIEGGVGALVGGKLLSKIPGAGIASKVLAKAAPIMSVLAAGTTVAAVGVITAAAAGFAGVMGIVNRGKENGLGYNPTPEQSKAIDPNQTRGPSEEEKARWQRGMRPLGNVVQAAPGVTTTVDADGNLTKRTGDRNWRNNNPGNLEYGPFAKSMGATGSDGRFAVFPDYGAGRKAMAEKLFNTDDYKGKNLTSAIAKWAPPGENNTAAYQQAVLAAVGGKDKPMSAYNPAEQEKILDAMQKKEGFRQGRTEELGTLPSKSKKVIPAAGNVRDVTQPTALQDMAPAPITAQLMGTEKLVAALNKQAAPKQETASLAPIKSQYSDTLLTLMAHDRI